MGAELGSVGSEGDGGVVLDEVSSGDVGLVGGENHADGGGLGYVNLPFVDDSSRDGDDEGVAFGGADEDGLGGRVEVEEVLEKGSCSIASVVLPDLVEDIVEVFGSELVDPLVVWDRRREHGRGRVGIVEGRGGGGGRGVGVEPEATLDG